VELANKSINLKSQTNYSLLTFLFFWCGLVIVSSLYITIPLLSVFTTALHISSAQATWIGSSFSLFYAIGFLFFGPISERYGRRKTMLVGMGVMSIVTLLIGIVNDLPVLILLRGIQGIAAATFAPSVLGYIPENFPAKKRVATIGFVSLGFLMAGIIGQVLSSVISQALDWNSVFYVFGFLYLVTTILIFFYVPKDIVSKDTNKDDVLSLGNMISHLSKQKALLFCYVLTLTLLFSFVSMYTVLGTYLKTVFDLTSQQILYIRSAGIIGMLVAPFAGRLINKFGVRSVLIIGITIAILGIGFLGIASNLIFIVLMSIVFVSGIAITVPSLISLVGMLGGAARSLAVSLYMFVLFIGASIGPSVATALLRKYSYTLTFEVIALSLAIGLCSILFVRANKIN
jgi:MFS transporter, YNFM family, putative membrane transport protein